MRRSPRASVSLTSLEGARRREGVGQVMGQVGAGSVLPPAVYRQVERDQQERHIGTYTTRRVSASLCAYERSTSFFRQRMGEKERGGEEREREEKVKELRGQFIQVFSPSTLTPCCCCAITS